MVKTFSVLLLSFSLLFSIVGPSVLKVLDFENNEVILIDSEEESQNKEGEISLEEDIKIIQSLSKAPNLYLDEDGIAFNFYEEDSSIYSASIHLPPPEFFI